MSDNRFALLEIDSDDAAAAPAPATPAPVAEARFALIELDEAPVAAPVVEAPAPAPAPAPVAEPTALTEGLRGVAAEYAAARAATAPSRSYLSDAERAEVRRRAEAEERAQRAVRDEAARLGLAVVARAEAAELARLRAEVEALRAAARRPRGAADLVALAEAGEVTGCLTYWNFGGTVGVAALEKAWETTGLDESLRPAIVGVEQALSRAVRGAAKDAAKARRVSLLPRKLEREDEAGLPGWALVEESQVDGVKRFRHISSTQVVLVDGEERVLTVGVDGEADEVEALRTAIEAEFSSLRRDLTASDLGTWLSQTVVPSVDATALKDKGGVYFVPAQSQTAWAAVVDLVDALSVGKVYRIPAMRSDDTARGAVDALVRDTAKAASEAEEVVRGVAAGEVIHPRTSATQLERLGAALDKVRRYESLLGADLGAMRARLEAARASVEQHTGDTRFSLVEFATSDAK